MVVVPERRRRLEIVVAFVLRSEIGPVAASSWVNQASGKPSLSESVWPPWRCVTTGQSPWAIACATIGSAMSVSSGRKPASGGSRLWKVTSTGTPEPARIDGPGKLGSVSGSA